MRIIHPESRLVNVKIVSGKCSNIIEFCVPKNVSNEELRITILESRNYYKENDKAYNAVIKRLKDNRIGGWHFIDAMDFYSPVADSIKIVIPEPIQNQ